LYAVTGLDKNRYIENKQIYLIDREILLPDNSLALSIPPYPIKRKRPHPSTKPPTMIGSSKPDVLRKVGRKQCVLK
jgi:hypothetical protein